jgi:hypothetical protein
MDLATDLELLRDRGEEAVAVAAQRRCEGSRVSWP